MARGGYRKPNNPAPVSGPGKLSRRTDGGPGSKQAQKEIRTSKYGESKALAEQQAGAPMAGNPAPTPKVQVPRGPATTPLFAPTQRPMEPVTTGLPFGDGAMSIQAGPKTTSEIVTFAKKYLPSFKDVAAVSTTPESFKSFVMYLEDMTK